MRAWLRENYWWLLLAATAIYMTVIRFDFWAGFMVATVLMYLGMRVANWWHERWLHKLTGKYERKG